MRVYEAQSIHAGTVRRPLGCFGCLSSLMAPLLGIPITLLTFGIIEWSRSGSDEAAVAAFAACPAITSVLGTPLRETTLSMGCGEFEGGGGSGDAEWSITIEGPKGRASAWYHAQYRGGSPWTILSAQATLPNGQTVTAVPCATPPAPPLPAPTAPEVPRTGKGKGKRR